MAWVLNCPTAGIDDRRRDAFVRQQAEGQALVAAGRFHRDLASDAGESWQNAAKPAIPAAEFSNRR